MEGQDTQTLKVMIESNELKITSPDSEPFTVKSNVNDVAKL